MRRIALTMLGALVFGVVLGTTVMAQVVDFSQRGTATGGLNATGFSIAHPSLPLNSSAKVVNLATGKEVDVTVIGRIAASPDRIVDLSPDVWRELALVPGVEVRVYTTPVARSRPVLPAAVPEPVATPMMATPVTATPAEPASVVVAPAAVEPVAVVAPPVITTPVTTGVVTEPQMAAPPTPTYPIQPVASVEALLIPGLPDPSSGKVYRLQIGAFTAPEAAERTARLAASLGFHAVWEQSGTIYRVFAIDVPAVLVQPAAQRLGSAGIKEIWVRE